MHAAERGTGKDINPDDPQTLDRQPRQLYDLSTDPRQRTNVYSRHPEKVKELTELPRSYVNQGRSTPGPPQANDDSYPYMRPWKQINWVNE